MTSQAYGQFCGFARALEVVGEPWALMVVRDLIVEPKSFEDLRLGLPRIPAGVLSARLEELEHAGVIRRSAPSGVAAVYELTEYGNELEDIVFRLSRWGAKKLGGPRRDEIVTADSMVMALRTMFRPEATRGLRLTYLLQLGAFAIHARIDDGHIEVGKGSVESPDLVMEAGPALKALMAGDMSPREAIESGGIRLTGDPGLLSWFVEIFRIPPVPPARSVETRKPAAIRTGDPALNGHSDRVSAYA
jgi:DNA-binding HxlR family transcriptional regulator/putative sterol carrier protein